MLLVWYGIKSKMSMVFVSNLPTGADEFIKVDEKTKDSDVLVEELSNRWISFVFII